MSHPNEAVLRRLFENFGDPAVIAEVFAEDGEWHEPGDGPISGPYRGREQVASLFAAVLSRSGETFRVVDIVDVLANEDHGCVFLDVEASREGRYIRTVDAIIFELRDGQVVRGRVLSEDQTEVDAFWD